MNRYRTQNSMALPLSALLSFSINTKPFHDFKKSIKLISIRKQMGAKIKCKLLKLLSFSELIAASSKVNDSQALLASFFAQITSIIC